MKNLKILYKMLLGIILPIAVLLSVASVVIMATVQKSVSDLSMNSLSAESQAVVNQAEEFFNRYLMIAQQAATNSSVEALLRNTPKGTRLGDGEGFSAIRTTLSKIVATDPTNILTSWVCDFDSSQYAQSDGAVSAADWDVTTRPVYAINEAKMPIVTEPYVDSASNNIIVSMAAPVFSEVNQSIIGATAIDIKLDQLVTLLSEYKIGKTGFIILTSGSGQIIYSPNKDDLQKSIADTTLSQNAKDAVLNKATGDLSYTIDGKQISGKLSTIGKTGWLVLTGIPQDELESASRTVAGVILLIMLILLPVMIIVIVLIARGIAKPLKNLSAISNRIADGDLDVTLHTGSTDEVGQVSSAIEKTVARLKDYINYIDEVSEILDQIAQGNLVFELHYDYVGEFSKIKDSLKNIQNTLSATFTQILESSQQVAAGSEQVAGGAQGLSQSTTEQAATIQQLSAAVNEIYETINQSALDCTTADRLTSESSEKLIEGNEEIKKMLGAMEDISNASKKIEKIIKAIDDIAFQTNILALNAAVEAARAGAAGKGFAVVADEVRNLASKSAQAAQDTTQLIQDAITAVEHGTKIADTTALTMTEVIDSSQQAAGIVRAISVSAANQTSAVQQMTQGIDQISAVVQTNAATAEESAAASEELSAQAAALQQVVRQFKM